MLTQKPYQGEDCDPCGNHKGRDCDNHKGKLDCEHCGNYKGKLDLTSYGNHKIKEAVCIHTREVYDACRDKDCLEDLRVYCTARGQSVVDHSINVKCRKAELVWVYIDVESVAFNRGFYSVEVKYFYKLYLDCFEGVGRPTEVHGLATFDKRVILFGSDGNAKIYSSNTRLDGLDSQARVKANMPTAVVETVEPIALSVKLVEKKHHHHHHHNHCLSEVPYGLQELFDDELVLDGGEKICYVSLGQFSIIRLERDTQLVMASYIKYQFAFPLSAVIIQLVHFRVNRGMLNFVCFMETNICWQSALCFS